MSKTALQPPMTSRAAERQIGQDGDERSRVSRPPFDVIPFAGDQWKVLDWKRGRYIRAYSTIAAARRYAGARNRKAGFYAAAIRTAPLCDCCGSSPCVRARRQS